MQSAIVLLDRSASMGAGREGKTPWEVARQRALKIIDGLPAGSALHLAVFDSGGITPTTPEALRAGGAAGLGGTDYGPAIDWARDLVLAAGNQRSIVSLISDLHRTGIRHRPDAPFPPSATVAIEDMGRPLARNVAVTDVQVETRDLRPGLPTTVAAEIVNTGSFPARDVRLILSLDNVSPVEKTLSLDAQARQVVRFPVELREPGLYQGSVGIAGADDFAADNRRWLAFEARRPERILLVDGEPGPSVYSHETYYLEAALRLRVPGMEDPAGETALRPSQPPEAPTPFETVRIDWGSSVADSGGSLPDLGGFRVVVLCNVAEVPEAAAQSLASFVNAGGQLVIFTGDRVRAGAYASLKQAGIFPAEVREPLDPGIFRCTSWQKDHPIFQAFDQPEHGDLRTLKFDRITRLVPAPRARELALVEGNLPLLVESSAGRGRCLLLSVPADNQWGDWAIQRLYLPLIHQLMSYLTDRLPESGRVRLELADAAPGHAPGIVMEKERIVVRNLDPSESELDRVTPATLREVYRLPVPQAPGRAVDDLKELLPGSQRPDELWSWILLALLAVLVAETFVANQTYA